MATVTTCASMTGRRSGATSSTSASCLGKRRLKALPGNAGEPPLLPGSSRFHVLSRLSRLSSLLLLRLRPSGSRTTATPRQVAGEHKAIFDATLARDGKKASARLKAHIERTGRNILSSMKS